MDSKSISRSVRFQSNMSDMVVSPGALAETVAPSKPEKFISYLRYLDDANRVIIKELQDNPGISQTSLAEKVGLSQSSVALRLAKLAESGLIKDSLVIDYRKLGLNAARVDISAKDADIVLDWAKNCPLCVNASAGIGTNNLSLYFVVEDLENLPWIIEKHLWRLPGVMEIKSTPLTSWMSGDGISSHLDLTVERSETPPCGALPFCPQCPKNPNYEGKVWAANGTNRDA